MQLTHETVDELVRDCLLKQGEHDGGVAMAEGIMRAFMFHPGRIADARTTIAELLAELPDEFRLDGGGGWSFLNASSDRHGRQWTGEHQMMEALFCLGIAAGQARWLTPREVWHILPGGMPYVVVL